MKNKKEWTQIKEELKKLHPIKRLFALRKIKTKDKTITKEIKKEIETILKKFTDQKLWKRIGLVDTGTKKELTEDEEEPIQSLESTVQEAVEEEIEEIKPKPEIDFSYQPPEDRQIYIHPTDTNLERDTTESLYSTPSQEKEKKVVGAYQSHERTGPTGMTSDLAKEIAKEEAKSLSDPHEIVDDMKKYSHEKQGEDHKYTRVKKGHRRFID